MAINLSVAIIHQEELAVLAGRTMSSLFGLTPRGGCSIWFAGIGAWRS